jgi:hypothetical protein
MSTNSEKIINAISHVIDANGPLVIEYNNQILSLNCVKIKEKHILKIAEQFENNDIKDILQTTDSSFLFK